MMLNEQHNLRGSGDNTLLRALSARDRALLEEDAEIVVMERDASLLHVGDRLDALYFPGSAIFALEEHIGVTGRAEVAVIGREGLIGWPLLLGASHTTLAAVVHLRAGTALRVPLATFDRARMRSPTLGPSLLRFVNVVLAHMSRAIASHLHDPVDVRIARWLLMRHDRIGGDVLLIQHDAIADSLNIRRASVTDCLHVLEGEKLVRCNRGKIVIRDRARMEAFAGQSYGVVEAHYREMIAPFGKSPTSAPVPLTVHEQAARPHEIA